MTIRWTVRAALCVVLTGLILTGGLLRADDWPACGARTATASAAKRACLKEWPQGRPKAAVEGQRAGHRLQRPGHRRQRPVHHGRQGRQGVGVGPRRQPAGQADLGRRRSARSATTAAAIPVRGPRPASTATASTPWASPATWCAWTSRTAESSGAATWSRISAAQIPQWGYAESVLVDGPWVVCTPGGAKNTIAALEQDHRRAGLGLAGRRSGRLLLGHQGRRSAA